MNDYLHPLVGQAYEVLHTGTPLTYELACGLSGLQGEAVADLLSLANKVRNRYACLEDGTVHSCSILNARSGLCAENCRFCAQSLHNEAGVEQYGLMKREQVFEAAGRVYAQGIRHFGIVTSGYGYRKITPEFERITGLIRDLKEEYPGLNVCASLGVLGPETAAALARAGIAHYNINIQVSPGRYHDLIADSHPVSDRIDTVRLLQKYGVEVCCGGILGVGESMMDRVDMIFELQRLDVAVIPLNVLVPVDGTPLEGSGAVAVSDIVKTFALCRLAHPRKIIKFAAGRETVMKDFQGLLMLSGANGFLTGGYLTTRGRDIADDQAFIEQLRHFGGGNS
ncbi:biotin synthase BioB [Prosthecochloris sp. HL-130-GSB]|jgi:biotin synthase|uniref:biotin synthase BioB n=1 Tax=Prosthecochloris sp. HL-130-GSB TaxID=1974213 RepID=UPI000A1C0920|nr:biotin synthase BioB [Prosthecochloris sp. HL-130-GSB]ARM31688.1 biotin synthase BioB [Prosthecochloris sp. HL-130-GSB]